MKPSEKRFLQKNGMLVSGENLDTGSSPEE